MFGGMPEMYVRVKMRCSQNVEEREWALELK
jgi:hypothetical protein